VKSISLICSWKQVQMGKLRSPQYDVRLVSAYSVYDPVHCDIEFDSKSNDKTQYRKFNNFGMPHYGPHCVTLDL